MSPVSVSTATTRSTTGIATAESIPSDYLDKVIELRTQCQEKVQELKNSERRSQELEDVSAVALQVLVAYGAAQAREGGHVYSMIKRTAPKIIDNVLVAPTALPSQGIEAIDPLLMQWFTPQNDYQTLLGGPFDPGLLLEANAPVF